ncbi:hypothetical protein OIU84_016312 [Salix udensis]|uniref:Uncharacterized protein n=1 Tax=Salix udensis TaxID=889485 RepID=A0AAD6J9M3_9ROSI|nr:hypothetical protein OIU84_016312 [Salix udensis]
MNNSSRGEWVPLEVDVGCSVARENAYSRRRTLAPRGHLKFLAWARVLRKAGTQLLIHLENLDANLFMSSEWVQLLAEDADLPHHSPLETCLSSQLSTFMIQVVDVAPAVSRDGPASQETWPESTQFWTTHLASLVSMDDREHMELMWENGRGSYARIGL